MDSPQYTSEDSYYKWIVLNTWKEEYFNGTAVVKF